MKRFMKAFMTRWPLAVSAASVALAVASGWAWIAGLGISIGGGIAAIAASSKINRLLDHVGAYGGALTSARVADLRELRVELRRLRRVRGVQREALQAAEQFDRVHQRFATFRDVLGRRFGAGEVTYGRYLRSAEQVYLSSLDSLRKIATFLQTAGTVDVDYINAQLRQLRRKPGTEEVSERESGVLQSRLRVRQEQLENARQLLSSNENAMTQMVSATSSLASVQTRDGLAASDTDTAVAELEALASRLGKYALDRDRNP